MRADTFYDSSNCLRLSQWPRGIRRGSAAVLLLGLWARILLGHGCLSLVTVICIQVGIYQIYFWNKTLHISDCSSVYHHEFFTVHTEMVYVCPDPARKLSANLYDIHHCRVYSEKLLMVDRGTVRNMQSFIPKIN